jgi:hypothetical protein
VAQWNGTNWVSDGNGSTTGTVVSGTITSSGAVTSFGPFALGSTTLANPLPIVLIKFEAIQKGELVELVWATASELNCDYFLVESANGDGEFEVIGNVDGTGTTTEAHEYRHLDKIPRDGRAYYRLTQVDLDGLTHIAGIAEVTVTHPFTVYPNPVADFLYINQNVNVKIIDGFGRLMFEGTASEPIDVRNLPPGLYFVSTAIATKKIMVKR